MKQSIALVVLSGLCALSLLAQDAKTNAPAKSTDPIKIEAADAKKHVGEEAIVSGTIAEVSKAAALVRLNFAKPYPNNVFTAVIFSRTTNDFPEVDKLKGKNVEVSGKISEFRNRPQIVVNSTNQIKVVEKPEKKAE